MTDKFRDDIQLAKACSTNDRTAQRALYERHRNALYRMALRYARDDAEAEDFVHDGLIHAFAKIGQYRGKGPLGGWLRRVVVNVILQELRKRPEITELDRSVEPGVEPEGFDEDAGAIPPATLHRYIKELPLGYRTVFSLYYLEDLTHEAIAKQLGISSGSSKSQLSKAKRKLRRTISTHHPHLQRQKK
ncbi:RNA polymerase sigma factor [Lewinella sp. 4G2]|uniref:RNA polymerase sigma factor n=1 Tax=Lewinella sp. 4G2 TaxID=1803372 RepID=UPI0007B47CDA|nr:sigma-70 family RNA polymerase sigma factor [Lewinella sp. 4G2]OAV44879.1 hypothetical protein A3850_010420 [Lewinella sp. 4G2]